MRRAPIPHNKCGNARVCGRRKGWLQLARALVGLAAAGLFFTLGAWPSAAQDPSLKVGQPGSGPSSTFAKPNGNIMGPQPPIDRAAPLYLQADQLLYDTKNNRVIAQG